MTKPQKPKESKPVVSDVNILQKEHLELLGVKYPVISGYIRKINFLWTDKDGSYYRINFYNPDRQNFPKSYFICVVGKAIKEYKNAPKKRESLPDF
jgi:hypothetical protein